MTPKQYESLAEQFDKLSEQMLAIAGTFREAADGGEDGSDDAPPARPGKATSAAAKKTAAKSVKSKPAADEDSSDDEIDQDTVREKLKELAETKGKEAMVAALASVGAGALKDVDESQYKELFDAAQAAIDAPEEDPEEALAKPAKKTAAKGKAKGPTLEQLQEAAKALIEADKAAFVKLSKKYGKPSECDEAKYGAFLKDIEAAMPQEDGADEGDEDLL